ncbi:MAG: hypothetical protein GY807_18115 [Gammaproteobacteria bacterium]|nr:hypothetical protein [Gammaproteobacteria bacterium]
MNIILVLGTLILGACAMPKTYESGMRNLNQRNYAHAVELLARAAAEKPGDDKIENALSKASRALATQHIESAERLSRYDLPTRISLLEKAAKLDPANSHAPNLLRQVTAEHEQILNESKRLQALVATDPKGAHEGFAALIPYQEYVDAVTTAGETINKTLIGKGYEALKGNRWAEARRSFEEALKVIPENPGARAGQKSIEAKKMARARRHEEAYRLLTEIEQMDPQNPVAVTLMPTVRRELVTQKLDKARRWASSSDTGRQIQAFEQYAAILGIAATDPAMVAKVEQAMNMLRGSVSTNLISRAKDLRKSNKYQYSAAILKLLQAAYRLSPPHAEKHTDIASFAWAITDEKKKLNLMIHFKDESRGRHNFAQLIGDELAASLEDADIAKLNIVHRDELQELVLNEESLAQGYSSRSREGIDLETAELIIFGKVLRNHFVETGRNMPRRRSSRYLAGTRQVDNPDWYRAKTNFEQTQQQYQQNRRQQEQIRANSAQQTGGNKWAAALSGLSAGLNEVSLNSARDQYYATPRYINEDVIQSYSYNEYTVKISGDVRVSYRFIDRRSSVASKWEVIKELSEVEETITEGVMETDMEGRKNRYGNLPDLFDEREKVQHKILREISTKVIGTLKEYHWKRFCDSGEKQHRRGNRDLALEYYSLCLEVARDQQGEAIETASKNVADFIGISEPVLQKYALVKERDDERWPYGPAALSEQEIQQIFR